MKDNININLTNIGCEDGRWLEPAQDRVQWQTLLLGVLNLRFLIAES
jgi:hypothetical protein